MNKKSCAGMIVLTFSLLLTAPAFADSIASAAEPDSSRVEVTWIPQIEAWLQSLMVRIEQALRDSAGTRGVADSKPWNPESSDPGMTLVPMGGADGDPNGKP